MTNATADIIWSAAEAAKATGGRSTKEWVAKSLSIDTRTIEKGALFIALKGHKGDGHAFVKEALKKGAAAAMVSEVPEGLDENAPLLIVNDTFKALEDLGAASRVRCGAKIIALTGSVGKTGTKEMIAAGLKAQGQTHSSPASFNNHWGVPFTLASMHAGTDFGVFEIGMNHGGEITPLSKMVKPDIAMITTIAPVHIENFDNIQGIADAKAEIFEGVKDGGTVILNRDNEWFDYLCAKAEARGLNVKSFGSSQECDASMTDFLGASNGCRVTATISGQKIYFTLQHSGKHIALNAIASLLAIHCAGGDIETAAREIGKIAPLPGRGKKELIDIGEKDNPVTLIDESYNASPVAMRAAFKVLALIDPGRGGRRIAILGDMYELGKTAAQDHADLALPLKAADVQLVYTCGPLMKNLYDSLPPEQQGAHRNESEELAQIVPDVLVPGDVVMVKGSRGGGEKPRMQVIVEALRAMKKP